jgi:hypothetical protein
MLLLVVLSLSRADAQGRKDPLSGTNAVDTNVTAAVTDEPAYLEVMIEDLYLAVEDAGLSFDVGRQVFLFQQNDDSFIVLVPFGGEGKFRLCAFPRISGRDQGTGWVTNEKLLFFGVRTRTMASRFYFDAGERLAVVAETNGIRTVRIERFGRSLEVDLPEDYPGLKYIPSPEPEVAVVAVAPKPPKTAPKPPPELDLSEDQQLQPVSTTPQLSEDAPMNETLLTSGDGGPVDVEGIAPLDSGSLVPTQAEPQGFKQRASAMISQYLWLLELLLALSILAAIPIIIKRNRASLMASPVYAEPPPAPSMMSAAAHAAPRSLAPPPMNMEIDDDEAVTHVETQIQKKSNDEFTGSLETFTMGDLIQFIHSTTKTGALEIQSGEAAGDKCLIFELGEIIDAVHGDKRGDEAVYSICRIKKGNYNFSREARSGVNKTVDKSTMTLLLDAHRIMDEESNQPAAEAAPAASPPPAEKAASAPRKKRQKLTMK